MSRWNHFAEQKYKQVMFKDIEIGQLFRNDFHRNGRRAKDIICKKTGELEYVEVKSGKKHTLFSVDRYTVSSFD